MVQWCNRFHYLTNLQFSSEGKQYGYEFYCIYNKFFFSDCRKHSSGDLQSRLKTRKILGVGETDNGDIHRSKVSGNVDIHRSKVSDNLNIHMSEVSDNSDIQLTLTNILSSPSLTYSAKLAPLTTKQ